MKKSPPHGSDLPTAVIVGLDCITGLQSARILAGHGIPVVAVAKNRAHYCCRTKVCREIIAADTAGEELIDCLEKLGPTFKQKAVLIPCTDMSVLMVSNNRQRLSAWFHIALPRMDVVETLMDKIRFIRFAQERNLPIPRTSILNNRADAERAAQEHSYPCVLKPPMKTPKWERSTNMKVYRVEDARQLLSLYDQCSDWSDVLLVQDWVEGPEANLFSCYCYFDAQSEPLVTFVARKERQWPPQTGTSSLGVECRNDEVLHESLRLFQSVNYHGLGYVEMKRDQRTGKHFIVEPNIGRPTGRSAIAEAGGVELLYTCYCDAVGLPLPAQRRQTYGSIKWIYWRRDLQAAWYAWRRGELSLLEWLRSWRGRKRCAVFSWSDWGPFLADLKEIPRRLLERFAEKRTKGKSSKPSPGPRESQEIELSRH